MHLEVDRKNRVPRLLSDGASINCFFRTRGRHSRTPQPKPLYNHLLNQFSHDRGGRNCNPLGMRILYAVQGTGNGHSARANEVLPHLEQHGEVDVLLSGKHSQLPLRTPAKYHVEGLGFAFGATGGIDYIQTLKDFSLPRLLLEVKQVPVRDYDLVVNDFEPVTAWACRRSGVPLVALSHQASFLSPQTPRPRWRNPLAELLFRFYAPAAEWIGFHFERYARSIRTPILRSAIRGVRPENEGHITVYLPAFSPDVLTPLLKQIREVRWEVFAKESKSLSVDENVTVHPVSGPGFLDSLRRSAGVMCGAGFETPAEALFLGKKLLVIPQRGQYEQACNAAALAEMQVPVVHRLSAETLPVIAEWARSNCTQSVHYPDETSQVVTDILPMPRMRRGKVVVGHERRNSAV